LWPDLTVEEHVRIFNKLKSPTSKVSTVEIADIILACDLTRKVKAQSKTLSGGQKRKLQLAMTFTGGSRVCCVDEVSSGLDPLSRRKIWDILLAERGVRSIILTTHFLDEAELLADHIAILSKGKLKAEGSSVELKNTLGDGYRITISSAITEDLPDIPGVLKGVFDQHTSYTIPDSAKTSEVVQLLDKMGIQDYQVSGPTIEDVFLKVADEVKFEQQRPSATPIVIKEKISGEELGIKEVVAETTSERSDEPEREIHLLPGRRIGMPRQAWVLFRKRVTILRRNYLPHLCAFLLPITAAGLVTLFLKTYPGASCNPADGISTSTIHGLESEINLDLVIGPSDRLTPSALGVFQEALPSGTGSESSLVANFTDSLKRVDTLAEFNQYINQNFANVTPGGLFLGAPGSTPTFAYRGDTGLYSAVIVQNVLDTLLTNISITTQYDAFDIPWAPDTGKALQLIVYFGLAMATYPAFFALYPTIERLRNVRALQYSNGVRALPLWLAYFAFDSCLVVLISAIASIIFAATSDIWYHAGYLFVVFTAYGTASAALAYFVSLFSSSQLAAFAVAAGLQAAMFLLYFIGYLSILTYAPTQSIDHYINVFHFTVATITPSGNLIRAMFVALNVFSVTCHGQEYASNPGAITLYGGPITYTILQTVFLLVLLVWWDSGSLVGKFRKNYKEEDLEEKETVDEDVTNELQRVSSSNDGLRVLHLSKNFKSLRAVQDLTFGVKRGEVFALLGPNGAGKSTTISLIRGDIQPSPNGGEVFVENYSVSKHRAAARAHLGVCPQFDAMDQMTAIEQLRFYAQVRGVGDVEYNVNEVIRAVGLGAFSDRMAAKLSGGNKRKLSLGAALMGNPTVLLLDEPSSGMDAAAKRVMWKTLASVVPGRSLVLTTHSMEEADALANRAGIMAGKMLALGTSDSLRRKHGDAYHVHLVTKTAPHTSDEEMDRIREWIQEHFPNADTEDKTYHGQLKFSVPTSGQQSKTRSSEDDEISSSSSIQKSGGISTLFVKLEDAKETLGLEHYSVSRTTLDQVFLSIVGKHEIEEENAGEEPQPRKKKRFLCL
jgi:ATP-binding cassette subfamily A (ABC1) protein 3